MLRDCAEEGKEEVKAGMPMAQAMAPAMVVLPCCAGGVSTHNCS